MKHIVTLSLAALVFLSLASPAGAFPFFGSIGDMMQFRVGEMAQAHRADDPMNASDAQCAKMKADAAALKKEVADMRANLPNTEQTYEMYKAVVEKSRDATLASNKAADECTQSTL